MHFKNWSDIKALHSNMEVWPGKDGGPMRFLYDRNRITERHSCDIPLKNGTTGKATRFLIPVKGGGRLNVSIAVHNAIKFAIRHLKPEQLDRAQVVLSMSGYGMERRYYAYASFQDPVVTEGPVETPKSEGGLPLGTHLMFLGPPRKNVIIDNLMDPPAARKDVCRCDIKDLLSTGHVSGCPEKRR